MSETSRKRAGAPPLFLCAMIALGAMTSAASARDWTVTAREGAAKVSALLKSGEVRGGDRILLGSGSYGPLTVRGARFDAPVEIVSTRPHRARFGEIRISDSENLTLRGVRVRPEIDRRWMPLVEVGTDSARVVLDRIDVASAPSGDRWTAAQWRERARVGVRLRGADSVLRDSTVSVVRIGVAASGRNSRVEGSLIEDFSEDGLRALGEGSVIRDNTIRNAFDVNRAHPDGIQAWSKGPDGSAGSGVLADVTLAGNSIIEWAKREDHPLRNRLQGIGLHDGFFEDWLIADNYVEVSSGNGIHLAGGHRTTVSGNVIVDATADDFVLPRLFLDPHKNGLSFGGNLVFGNSAPKIKIIPSEIAPSLVVGSLLAMMEEDYPSGFSRSCCATGMAALAMSEVDAMGAAASAVPAPAGLPLALTGLAALGLLRRRGGRGRARREEGRKTP